MLDPRGNDTKLRIPDNSDVAKRSRIGAPAIRDQRRGELAGSGSRRPALPSRQLVPGWGSRPGRLGVFAIITAALLGAVLTAISSRDPGPVLGAFILVGTAVAASVVRLRSVYVIFPVPALAYVGAAVIAGLIHDRATDTSNTALTLSAVQWIASGFVVMTAATILAIVIAAGRWLWWRWVWHQKMTIGHGNLRRQGPRL
jgi:hypothetical protein